ncbi:MarR family winged helix-turn-helix transcriptional regulator [Cypionkella psychrotolerans]|uniref:MarR family winged helix-turn-helix transcriptional regulator n=1 Tax=Cypionkella psychrotolerans TaxID=1678131 RepID=UPI0006B5387E|nr:MarR family transcriptional regulator [Cypionkella psychrotolerans]
MTPAALASVCYCAALRKATRRVTAIYDRALDKHGISLAQYSLLRTIRRRGPISLTELAAVMELDRSTIGRNVRVVEKAGWVRPADSLDQREAAIALTENGAELLLRAYADWAATQDAIAAKLGAGGAEALLEVLAGL